MLHWVQRFRYRYQLPEAFKLSDLLASLATRPTRIENFEVAQISPKQHVSELANQAMQQEGAPFLKWWHYFDAYERELAELATASRSGKLERPLRILEIGVWRGGSLNLWRRYFGENAVIFGIDIDPESAQWATGHAQIRIGSQVDSDFMMETIQEMGGVDIVIDDGSHQSRHVIESLRMLWPVLEFNGIYIIEDLHTSYWPEWGGGLRRSGSSIETIKGLIDVLHQPYFGAPADQSGLGISREELASVTFYDSMAVLHKQEMPEPRPFHGGSTYA